jgi:hypothetical protein
MKPSYPFIVASVCLLWLAPASSNLLTAAPATACTGPEFRQFDFWLGKWNVSSREGKELGRSEISRASGSCAIREEWQSSSGISGMSINYYDRADGRWHQDWVGSDGAILHLHGELAGNAMVLRGESKEGGKIVINRITWTPLPGGKVKQEWSISPDNGDTWNTSFIGIYEKKA